MATKSQMLNVNMNINADASKAKQQIQSLQDSLTSLLNTTKGKGAFNLTEDLNDSIKGVALLKAQLQDATNVKTGKLDLSKFNQSLKESGMSLEKYRDLFSNMGKAGDRAFAQLATSITDAEIPLKRSSKLVDDLWTTLKNTAKWQLSSSIMHGFMGAVQSALYYTQDLNKSLNDIRIVTGYNTDQMAEFAKQANRAAKNLSTTTTDYTNASLIYYQQGLPEDEIAKRTEITIKMANAAGVSAEKVSDQMTAVWNNFAKGGENLEYYADVMTALGAATASSTDEIAAGLEKFAAVSGTIGLSYEYAAASLATITAETRQSADVVGNALKTLFSRIQGLNLGETLEDGTDLNKYSAALDKVGISIKDASGNVKEMDTILDELGSRWGELAKDEQLAVAQTVAGVRQYTQLIALMDNWDTFKDNVTIAESSEGTVSQQAEIYAESWEAARNRVQAAAEGIYDSILDDKFFIGINNGFAEFLTGIENVIDGLGGMDGVLLLLGATITKVFNKQISQGIKDLAYNFKMLTKSGQESMRAFQNKANTLLIDEMLGNDKNLKSNSANALKEQAKAQQAYLDNAPYMTDIQKQQADMFRDKQKMLIEEIQLLEEEGQQIEKNYQKELKQYNNKKLSYNEKNGKYFGLNERGKISGSVESNNSFLELAERAGKLHGILDKVHYGFDKIDKTNFSNIKDELKQLGSSGKDIGTIYGQEVVEDLNKFIIALEKVDNKADASEEDFKELQEAFQKLRTSMTVDTGAEILIQKLETLSDVIGTDEVAAIKKAIEAFYQKGAAAGELSGKTQGLTTYTNKLIEAFKNLKNQSFTAIDGFVAFGSALGSLASAFQSIKGLTDIWNDDNLSDWEKALTTITTMSMVLVSLKSSFQTDDVVKMGAVFGKVGNAILNTGGAAANAAGAISKVGAAAGGAAVEGTTLAAALAQAGTSLGAVAVGAGVVIAVIAALGIGIYALVKHINRYKDAAKDAADAAQELSDASLETRNRLNDIKDAFDTYDSAKKALDECTRGTEEWNKQLKEVNDQALNILETYPELMKEANLFTRDDNGVLQINDDVKENAISKLESQARSQQAASYLSSAQAKNAQNEKDFYDFQRQHSNFQYGSTNGGDNTLYFDDALTQENIVKLSQLNYEEFEKELANLIKQPADMADESWKELVNELYGYQDEMRKMANGVEQFTNQINNATDLIISENFEELEGAEKEVAENMLKNNSKAFYDEIMKADKTGGDEFDRDRKFSINGEDKTLDDLWEVYANVKGINGTLKDNGIRGWVGDKKIVYDDATTGKVERINMETFASVVSAQLALESLGVSAENATKALNGISDTDEGNDFRNYLSNKDFSSMSEEDLNTYNTENGAVDYLKTVFGLGADEDFNAYFNENLETMQALGFDSAEKMIEAIQNGIEGQSEALNSVGEGLVKTVRNSYNEAIEGMGDSLSTQDHQKIGQMLTDVFVDSGAEGLEEVSNMLGGLGESADEFMGAVEDIDWNTVTLDELKASLESAGIETNGLDGALQILINAMGRTEEATLSLANAQGQHANFQNLGDLEMGDTISQEQMQSMIDVNPALAQYFQLMGDGTYALVENAEYFQGIVEDLSFKPLTDQLEYMQGQYQAMQTASSYDYEGRLAALGPEGNPLDRLDLSSDIEYLKATGTQSMDQIKDWEIRNAEKGLTGEDYDQIYNALKECEQATIDWDEKMQELSTQMGEINEAINFTAYKDHVEDLGLDFGVTERYAQDLAEAMEKSGQEYDNLQEAARNLAIANQRLDRGLSNLASNLDDYNEKLSDSNRYSTEYSEALQDLKTDIADIFNADASLLGDGFIEEQLVGDPEKLRQIADGNMEVINAMRGKVAEEMVLNVRSQVNTDELDTFLTSYDALKEVFAYEDLSVGVAMMGEDAFIENLNNLIASANMTRDQVNALLGSMGMSAELTTDYKEQKVDVPIYTTMTKVVGQTQSFTRRTIDGETVVEPNTYDTTETMTYQSGTATMDGFVPVTAIKTVAADGTASGGGIDILTKSSGANAPSGSGSSSAPTISPSKSNVYDPSTGKGGYTGNKKSSGGGGGNKEAKTSDPKKLEDEIDRYYDINNVLEKISRQLKKIQNQSDTLYGASKIAAMEHEIEVLKEQEQAYKDKAAAAEDFIKTDREAAAQWGYTLSYDADGNISNYQQVMTQAVADLNAYKQQYNAMSADEQEQFEPVLKSAEDRYEGLLDAMSKYKETLQEFRDAEDAAEEARLQILAKNYEKIAHKLEYKLSMVEQEIEEIDYYVNKLSDDFYSMGEALAMTSGKTDEYFKILNLHSLAIEELSAAYEAGEITKADYIEGMENERQGIYDALEALQEIDKFMLDYYGETLDAATDEIEKFTDQMDHLNNVLEHYQNIMSLIGKENNYDQMGILLKGQADIAQDSLEVAKATYEMFKQQKEDILAQMEGVEEGSAAWDGFKRQLDDITVKLNDAEEEMLSRTEEWVGAMRSLLENDLANAYKTLENSFTNGMGFDYLTDSIDRARKHYDLFLTNTNKLYETNKLINNAQAKADKLTSLSAKQKVKDFIDETQALQDKNKLSKIELQIQQAKYDLVLAQIALEEAQNSKTKVRLQRDSEGNFNYVYTSDAEAISEAEQNLMDAENALYNIRLEAANAAGEQMVTTAREWADALYQVDLDYMNGVITSEEEWRAKRDQINKDFLQQMADYQDQYGIATKEDGKIVSDAWCNPDDGAYPLITKSAEDWKINTNNYISQVNGAFEEWKTVVDQANEVVGKDLDATKQKVNELTEASDALKDEVVNEVLPAIESELNTVQGLTSAYFNQRQEIMNLIGEYERLAERIKDAIDAQKELNAYQAQAQKDLSDSYTGEQYVYADKAEQKTQGHTQGGGLKTKKEEKEKKETPEEKVKLYKFWANFKDGSACNGAGYKTAAAAQDAYAAEGSKHGGIASAGTSPYMGAKNEMAFIQYTKLPTKTKSSNPNGYVSQADLNRQTYDTGGYTGSWGPEGKLATLHEKELVLNKSDTKNMLSAVEIVRDINNQIENSAKYFGGLGGNIHLPGIMDMSHIIEQQVQIEANFPSVVDRHEIEDAFENLVNMASQFANRKKF